MKHGLFTGQHTTRCTSPWRVCSIRTGRFRHIGAWCVPDLPIYRTMRNKTRFLPSRYYAYILRRNSPAAVFSKDTPAHTGRDEKGSKAARRDYPGAMVCHAVEIMCGRQGWGKCVGGGGGTILCRHNFNIGILPTFSLFSYRQLLNAPALDLFSHRVRKLWFEQFRRNSAFSASSVFVAELSLSVSLSPSICLCLSDSLSLSLSPSLPACFSPPSIPLSALWICFFTTLSVSKKGHVRGEIRVQNNFRHDTSFLSSPCPYFLSPSLSAHCGLLPLRLSSINLSYAPQRSMLALLANPVVSYFVV